MECNRTSAGIDFEHKVTSEITRSVSEGKESSWSQSSWIKLTAPAGKLYKVTQHIHAPPPEGFGLSHTRVLFAIPFPHITLHVDQSEQSLKPPFTTE